MRCEGEAGKEKKWQKGMRERERERERDVNNAR